MNTLPEATVSGVPEANTRGGANASALHPFETVGSTGERHVLAKVLAEYEVNAAAAVIGPGDDCAVLRVAGNPVVTTDNMIENVDFRLDWHTGEDLGWKLAATNLSDVAAMGAVPIGLTVAVACPPHTPVKLLSEIARGLNRACTELAPGCGVVGGDLGQAPVLMIAVTALGDLESRQPVLRSGAAAGEVLAYAGQLGLAGRGLRDLFAGNFTESSALRAQLAPQPPIVAGLLAASAGATSMLDVSDGLSFDAARIARASSVALAFSSELLLAGFETQEGTVLSLAELLSSGEDHGLLATFPVDAALPAGFLPVGAVVEAELSSTGVLLDGAEFTPSGWDPFVTETV